MADEEKKRQEETALKANNEDAASAVSKPDPNTAKEGDNLPPKPEGRDKKSENAKAENIGLALPLQKREDKQENPLPERQRAERPSVREDVQPEKEVAERRENLIQENPLPEKQRAERPPVRENAPPNEKAMKGGENPAQRPPIYDLGFSTAPAEGRTVAHFTFRPARTPRAAERQQRAIQDIWERVGQPVSMRQTPEGTIFYTRQLGDERHPAGLYSVFVNERGMTVRQIMNEQEFAEVQRLSALAPNNPFDERQNLPEFAPQGNEDIKNPPMEEEAQPAEEVAAKPNQELPAQPAAEEDNSPGAVEARKAKEAQPPTAPAPEEKGGGKGGLGGESDGIVTVRIAPGTKIKVKDNDTLEFQ